MTMRDRLSLAWRALRGQNVKSLATMVETWKENQPSYSPVSFSEMVKSGYRKNELIYACISKTANTASQVGLVVKDAPDGEVVDGHPMKRLIQRPNRFMTEFDLWTAVIVYQKLAGRAIFEKVRARSGQVVELWPLRPDWVTPLPSSKSMIGAYQYEVPGLPKVLIPPENVLDFKLWDPLDLYHGYPPVAVAARVGDADNAATDHIKLVWEKGGVPAGLLKTTQKLKDVNIEDIRRRWRARYGGHENWLEPVVLDQDAEYQKIGLDFEELNFEILDARSEARICMVLQVPPILVGAKMGLDRATYSNYGEARLAWWQDDLTPMYANFQDVLENQLAYEFGECYPEMDFSRVPALQEQRAALWERANTALVSGGITVNEYRKELNLEDIEKWGDVFLRSSSVTEVPKKGERPKPEPIAIPASPDEDEGEPESEMPEDEEMPMEEEAPEKSRQRKALDPETRRKHEEAIAGAMEAWFEGQLKRIKENV